MIRNLPKILADAQYVAARPLTLEGRELKPGDPIPSGAFTRHRLKTLFNGRFIDIASASSPAAPTASTPTEE